MRVFYSRDRFGHWALIFLKVWHMHKVIVKVWIGTEQSSKTSRSLHRHFSNCSSLLYRIAECASSAERERAGSGTTPACCVRSVSKIRILLCAVRCVPASWTQSITKTYCSATFVRGTEPLLTLLKHISITIFNQLHFVNVWCLEIICETISDLQYNMTISTWSYLTDGYTWSVSVRTQAKQKSSPERTTFVQTASLLLQSLQRTWK